MEPCVRDNEIAGFHGSFVLLVCYYWRMSTTRHKRSVSLPEALSVAVDAAAEADHTTPSAWLADAARRKLLIENGIREMTSWLAENGGPASEEETIDAETFVSQVLKTDQ